MSPRPVATALAVIWERQERWIVRERADQRWQVVLSVALLVLGAIGAVTLTPAFAAIGVLALVTLVRARPGGTSTIDLAARTVTAAGRTVSFADIDAVVLETGLEVRPSQYGPPAGRQVWWLDVATVDETIRLATHGTESAIVGPARRLARLLDRPVVDRCGPPGTTVRRNPRGDWELSAEPDRRPRTVTETKTAGGFALSWRTSWLSPLIVVAVIWLGAGVLVVLCTTHLDEPWLSVALFAYLAPALAKGSDVFRRGPATIVVTPDHLDVRAGAPVHRRVRIARDRGIDMRLSRHIVPVVSARVPQPSDTRLDVMEGERRLASVTLSSSDAVWVAARLHTALQPGAAQRPRR